MRVALHLYSDPSDSLASTKRWSFCIHCPTEDLCSGADSLSPSQTQPPNQGLTPCIVMDLLGIENTMAQMGLFTLQATHRTALWAFEKLLYLQTASFPLPHCRSRHGTYKDKQEEDGLSSSTAQGLVAFMLTFQCINSRTIELELFLSTALNITRESGRTTRTGLIGEVEISVGLSRLTCSRWALCIFA